MCLWLALAAIALRVCALASDIHACCDSVQANQRSSSRRGLYPCLGQLYPEGIELLSKVRRRTPCNPPATSPHCLQHPHVPVGARARVQVDTEDKLGRLLDKYPDYRRLWESAPLDEVRVWVVSRVTPPTSHWRSRGALVRTTALHTRNPWLPAPRCGCRATRRTSTDPSINVLYGCWSWLSTGSFTTVRVRLPPPLPPGHPPPAPSLVLTLPHPRP